MGCTSYDSGKSYSVSEYMSSYVFNFICLIYVSEYMFSYIIAIPPLRTQ